LPFLNGSGILRGASAGRALTRSGLQPAPGTSRAGFFVDGKGENNAKRLVS
jgi:hypothetical protein